MLADAGHLCARGGVILAQKGRFPEAEVAGVPPGWSLARAELTVPGLPKARHLLTLRRQHAS
jgi:16S rRNA (guanine527-N7)-methyltransferase